MPPSYIRVRAVVWAYGRGRQTERQTDTQTRVTTIHFASSTTHAKCNNMFVYYRLSNATIQKYDGLYYSALSLYEFKQTDAGYETPITNNIYVSDVAFMSSFVFHPLQFRPSLSHPVVSSPGVGPSIIRSYLCTFGSIRPSFPVVTFQW